MSRANLVRQAEGEGAEQLRERGRQVEPRQALADAVARALAERHEALHRPVAHLCAVAGLLDAALHAPHWRELAAGRVSTIEREARPPCPFQSFVKA